MIPYSDEWYAALHPQELVDLRWFEFHPGYDELLRPINWQIDPWMGKRGWQGHLYSHVTVLRIDLGLSPMYSYVPTERESALNDQARGIPLVDQIVLVDQRHGKKGQVLKADSQQYKAIYWMEVGDK
jgi:hypothetical protein